MPDVATSQQLCLQASRDFPLRQTPHDVGQDCSLGRVRGVTFGPGPTRCTAGFPAVLRWRWVRSSLEGEHCTATLTTVTLVMLPPSGATRCHVSVCVMLPIGR